MCCLEMVLGGILIFVLYNLISWWGLIRGVLEIYATALRLLLFVGGYMLVSFAQSADLFVKCLQLRFACCFFGFRNCAALITSFFALIVNHVVALLPLYT